MKTDVKNAEHIGKRNKSLPQKSLKECYGTKEWSEKSGICSKCKLKKDCGKSIKKSKN